jgi:hypothetical protein
MEPDGPLADARSGQALAPGELAFLAALAGDLPPRAAAACLPPADAAALSSLREGHARAGAPDLRLILPLAGETPADFLARLAPASVDLILDTAGGPEPAIGAGERLRHGGVLLTRNRIRHGFSLTFAPGRRITDQLFDCVDWPQDEPPLPGPLVMGMAAGYSWEKIAPFALSLRQSGFAGEAVLFAAGLAPATVETLAAHGLRVIRAKRAPIARHVSVNCLRYFLYEEFLARRGAAHPAVFLTDVADVVFQGDVFAHAAGGLTLFAEAGRLREEPWNAGWVRNLYGEETLAAFGGERISCSGTVLGHVAAVREYLRRMTAALVPLQAALRDQAMPGTGMHGADQGVHNVLLRRGLLPDCRLLTNADGVVYTYDGEFLSLPDGRVGTPEGAPYAVVHQYNRNPRLVRHILSRVAPWHPQAQIRPPARKPRGRPSGG